MARIWHLAKPPGETLTHDVFELKHVADEALAEGQVRVNNRWLSIDPFVRRLLGGGTPDMPGVAPHSALYGGAIGEVIESRADAFAVGALVMHYAGWRDLSVLPSDACQAVPVNGAPIQRYLGHLGVSGQTGYFGLLSVAQAKAGDVVFVSAAAGAVGSLVVQIAKLKDMTVIASTGGAHKCVALGELGADAVIDYKAPGSLRSKLAAAAPTGIDVYFDNVGGEHLDAAIESARMGARFALCGMVSAYAGNDVLMLPDPMRLVLKRLMLRGFSAPDFNFRHAEFHDDVLRWILSGQLRSPETILHGLESTPEAFSRLFDGGNFGKMLVKL